MATFSTSNFYSIERPENILNSSGTFTHFVCPIGFYGFWVHSDYRQGRDPNGNMLSGGLSNNVIGVNNEDLSVSLFGFGGTVLDPTLSSQFSEISVVTIGQVGSNAFTTAYMRRVLAGSLGNEQGGFRYLNGGDTLVVNVNAYQGATGWLRSTIFLYKNP